MSTDTQTPLPAGTVTFLFTDVQGSTRLLEAHGSAYRAALACHHTLLLEAVEQHGGIVFETVGDAVYAAFAQASAAAAAALAAQQALHAQDWGTVGAIRVRMGLHTGEAEVHGRHYVGVPLYRCARLMATAHGGQTVLSQATVDLLHDELPAGALLRDLGPHRLKDLTRPEHVYELVDAARPEVFPPLKSLEGRAHNLPVQLTPFIGREREVEAVRARLLEPQTRLLTLTGPGGTGKTRLALQAAAEALDDFGDGVFFVDLAALRDAALVLPAIARELGLREAGGQPLRETLSAYLREQHLLLVLDNFEQVLAAAPQVNDLLAACPYVTVLATSRAPLRVRGERTHAVPALAVPGHPPPPLEVLSQYEAVRLFIARAQDVLPSFAVTNETAPAVAEICARLDGLPLAIELAAARVRLLSPEALLARLGQRLKVVTGGSRDLPARQQTLRAAIEWSYNLLSAEEQQLFARLAVFVSGATLEAIEAVCGAGGDLAVDVLDGVEALLDNNLLRREEDVGAEPRYVMLETIHEYAREQLAARGETEALRRAHAAYFLALAEQAEPELRGPAQATWLARLEREHDNLRAALSWAGESTGAVRPAAPDAAPESGVVGLRLVAALWRFWYVRGHLSEGRRQLERVLAATPVAAGDAGVSAARARALQGAGSLARHQGDTPAAQALFEQSLALFREQGDQRSCAGVLGSLGIVAHGRGDYKRARALYEEYLALSRALGDARGSGNALNNLGIMALEQGDPARARALTEEGLALFRQLGDKRGAAHALSTLADITKEQGEVGQALALYEACLSQSQELADKRGSAYALFGMGTVLWHQGEHERARALFEQSLALFDELGDRDSRAYSLLDLGAMALEQGEYDRARALLLESLILCHASSHQFCVVHALERLAQVDGVAANPGCNMRRAARLFGAAEGLLAASALRLRPSETAAHERSVALLRDALGDDAFTAAWAEGRAMSVEQAVAEARAARN